MKTALNLPVVVILLLGISAHAQSGGVPTDGEAPLTATEVNRLLAALPALAKSAGRQDWSPSLESGWAVTGPDHTTMLQGDFDDVEAIARKHGLDPDQLMVQLRDLVEGFRALQLSRYSAEELAAPIPELPASGAPAREQELVLLKRRLGSHAPPLLREMADGPNARLLRPLLPKVQNTFKEAQKAFNAAKPAKARKMAGVWQALLPLNAAVMQAYAGAPSPERDRRVSSVFQRLIQLAEKDKVSPEALARLGKRARLAIARGEPLSPADADAVLKEAEELILRVP